MQKLHISGADDMQFLHNSRSFIMHILHILKKNGPLRKERPIRAFTASKSLGAVSGPCRT